jgi:hypothetical protein
MRSKSGEFDLPNHQLAAARFDDPNTGAAGRFGDANIGAAGTGTGAACAGATDVRLAATAIAHAAPPNLAFATILLIYPPGNTRSDSLN